MNSFFLLIIIFKDGMLQHEVVAVDKVKIIKDLYLNSKFHQPTFDIQSIDYENDGYSVILNASYDEKKLNEFIAHLSGLVHKQPSTIIQSVADNYDVDVNKIFIQY